MDDGSLFYTPKLKSQTKYPNLERQYEKYLRKII